MHDMLVIYNIFYPFLPSAAKGDVQTNSHNGVHSSKWEYWFKPMGKKQCIITYVHIRFH